MQYSLYIPSGRRLKLISVISVLCFLVFCVEILSGLINKMSWAEFKNSSGHTFDKPDLEKDETLRILFVADPQIIGEENESFLLGIISRWDSDTYLHRNYKLAKFHVQPHIVVFLGDLFDEGTEAHDTQYRRYIKRFNEIFELPSPLSLSTIEYLFLPGDNDIAHGDHGPINLTKLKWFKLTFGDFDDPFWLTKAGWNIQLLKMWSMGFSSHEAHEKFLHKITNISKDKFDGLRIILSHMPYWKYSSAAIRQMTSVLKPTLILSGNDHRSSLLVFNEDSYQYQRTTSFQLIPNATEPFYRVNLNKASDDKVALKEISVPTCSYRMGVPNMGFGALQLFKNGTMAYTVLWLPSRFNQLKIYFGLYICWKLIFTPWILWKIYCLVINKYRNWRKQEKDNKHSV